MKKRNLQTSSNYKFQQQQKNREEYKKVKEAKEKFKKMPLDASEELDYIKRLLNGEDVGNFGPEEVMKEINSFENDAESFMQKLTLKTQKMTLSQFLSGTSRTRTKENFPF